jgi:hypothetical protein
MRPASVRPVKPTFAPPAPRDARKFGVWQAKLGRGWGVEGISLVTAYYNMLTAGAEMLAAGGRSASQNGR